MTMSVETGRYFKPGRGRRRGDTPIDLDEPRPGSGKSPRDLALGCCFLAAFLFNGAAFALGGGGGSTLSLVPRGTERPSFDCRIAKTAAARLICADGELARLDGEQGEAFRKHKDSVPAIDQPKFVASQMAWIRKRNEDCGLKDKEGATIEALAGFKPCLASAFRQRIDSLNQTRVANIPIGSDQTLRQPVRENCYQDSCSWMRLTARAVVGNDLNDGQLVRSIVEHADTRVVEGSPTTPANTDWKVAREVFAFCSHKKPAIVDGWDGAWRADLLAPGYPDQVYETTELQLIEYFLICHGLTNADIRDPTLAARYGYSADVVKGVGSVALAAPRDIMDSEAQDGAVFVQISVTASPTNPPVITGTTNLPPNAKLIVNLRGDPPRCVPKCGIGYGTATVEGGRFTATTGQASPLISGSYTVDISMGPAFTQPENVQRVIGKNGERLRGPWIMALENGKFIPAKFPRNVDNSGSWLFVQYKQRIEVVGDQSFDSVAKARAIAEWRQWSAKSCIDSMILNNATMTGTERQAAIDSCMDRNETKLQKEIRE
jgi:uncharacterized protein YecT (DUF1311 family)